MQTFAISKVVKFELILTHLQLFGANGGGEQKYFGGKILPPPAPPLLTKPDSGLL